MKEVKPIPNKYLVDFDGTICQTDWDGKIFAMGKPIPGMREAVNKVGEKSEIVIFTARPKKEFKLVRRWLVDNGVHFDKVSNKKVPARGYVDDRAIYPQDFIDQHTDVFDGSSAFDRNNDI